MEADASRAGELEWRADGWISALPVLELLVVPINAPTIMLPERVRVQRGCSVVGGRARRVAHGQARERVTKGGWSMEILT